MHQSIKSPGNCGKILCQSIAYTPYNLMMTLPFVLLHVHIPQTLKGWCSRDSVHWLVYTTFWMHGSTGRNISCSSKLLLDAFKNEFYESGVSNFPPVAVSVSLPYPLLAAVRQVCRLDCSQTICSCKQHFSLCFGVSVCSVDFYRMMCSEDSSRDFLHSLHIQLLLTH